MPALTRPALSLAALLALISVVTGAFGSHGLEHELEARDTLDSWRIGVRYAMWHALALLAWAAARESVGANLGGRWVLIPFVVGSLMFSGSIFGLALGGPGAILGPITPLGGVLLIVGWSVLLVAGLTYKPAKS